MTTLASSSPFALAAHIPLAGRGRSPVRLAGLVGGARVLSLRRVERIERWEED